MAAPTRESTRQKYHTSTNEEAGYTRLKHVYIRMRDGIELCADVFLPFSASKEGQRVPVLCSLGPYGKDIHAASFGLPKTPIYASMYKEIKPLGPDACFELVEPMIWVSLPQWASQSTDNAVMLNTRNIEACRDGAENVFVDQGLGLCGCSRRRERYRR